MKNQKTLNNHIAKQHSNQLLSFDDFENDNHDIVSGSLVPKKAPKKKKKKKGVRRKEERKESEETEKATKIRIS